MSNDSVMNSGKKMGDEEKGTQSVVAEGKWITHYNSNHRILLLGEGDFSFSASLARAFKHTPNIIATSLDSQDFLRENYSYAMSNILGLRNAGCMVMHGIDATKVANHHFLGGKSFDRIVFNFPFAGFFKGYTQETILSLHRELVSKFLMNAKEMIDKDGEIHITHKTNYVHLQWNLESIASSHKLKLIEAVNFKQFDYPGYSTKRGFGGDKDFPCYPSKTYKFGLEK